MTIRRTLKGAHCGLNRFEAANVGTDKLVRMRVTMKVVAAGLEVEGIDERIEVSVTIDRMSPQRIRGLSRPYESYCGTGSSLSAVRNQNSMSCSSSRLPTATFANRCRCRS